MAHDGARAVEVQRVTAPGIAPGARDQPAFGVDLGIVDRARFVGAPEPEQGRVADVHVAGMHEHDVATLPDLGRAPRLDHHVPAQVRHVTREVRRGREMIARQGRHRDVAVPRIEHGQLLVGLAHVDRGENEPVALFPTRGRDGEVQDLVAGARSVGEGGIQRSDLHCPADRHRAMGNETPAHQERIAVPISILAVAGEAETRGRRGGDRMRDGSHFEVPTGSDKQGVDG